MSAREFTSCEGEGKDDEKIDAIDMRGIPYWVAGSDVVARFTESLSGAVAACIRRHGNASRGARMTSFSVIFARTLRRFVVMGACCWSAAPILAADGPEAATPPATRADAEASALGRLPVDTRAGTAGSLEIASRPRGARVFLNGQPVGITPLRISGLTPGPHTIRLEQSGYRSWTDTVNAVTAQLTRVSASLEPASQR